MKPDEDTKAAIGDWSDVQALCEAKGKYSPECLTNQYDQLAGDNTMEWFTVIFIWFDNQPWIAFLGLFLSVYSYWIGWAILLFPEIKPDISDPHWDKKPYYWDGWTFEQIDFVS